MTVMKKKSKLFGAIVCLLMAASCDVVDNYTVPYQPPTAAEEQTVLLEEYTGMLCVNCPAAAREAQLLKETFGKKLIVVAIHAGDFAKPNANFRTDLRSEAGEAYWKAFGFAFNPVGMVNRSVWSGSVTLNPVNWATAVRGELAVESSVRLELHTDYDKSTRAYTCDIVASGLTGQETEITLWLVEDEIVAPQVIPGGTDKNYVQRHVLRGALNGTWGEPIVPDDKGVWHAERSYLLPAHYDAGKCSIVAFAATASRKIVCVTETPL